MVFGKQQKPLKLKQKTVFTYATNAEDSYSKTI